jgi:hypothetical protein
MCPEHGTTGGNIWHDEVLWVNTSSAPPHSAPDQRDAGMVSSIRFALQTLTEFDQFRERLSILDAIGVAFRVDDVVERRDRNPHLTGRDMSCTVPQGGVPDIGTIEIRDCGENVDAPRIRAPHGRRCASEEVWMEQLLGQLFGGAVIDALDPKPRSTHLPKRSTQPAVVLSGLSSDTVDVPCRTFGTPQQRRSPTNDHEVDVMVRERTKDQALVDFPVIVIGHDIRRPSLRN